MECPYTEGGVAMKLAHAHPPNIAPVLLQGTIEFKNFLCTSENNTWSAIILKGVWPRNLRMFTRQVSYLYYHGVQKLSVYDTALADSKLSAISHNPNLLNDSVCHYIAKVILFSTVCTEAGQQCVLV